MSTPRGDGGRGGRGGRGDYAREPQLGSAPSHPRVNPRGGGRGGGRDGRGRDQSGSGSSQPLGGGRGGGRGFRRPGEYQRELEAGVPHNQPRGGIGGGGRGRGYPGGGDGAVAAPPPPFHTSSAPPELRNQPPPSEERQRTVHLPSSSSSAAMGKELEQKLVGEPSGTAPTALLAPVSSKGMKHPARPGFGTVGRKCVVRANHFLVQVSDKDLHHYDVAITPEVISRSVNRSVIARLVELYGESHLGRRKPAYDGSKSLYTAGALPFTSKNFAIKLMETDERGKTKKEREFKVTIKLAGRPDLHHLQEFLRGRYAEVPQETIQVLDVVLRESPSNNFITVARSFFSPSFGDRRDMGEGLECCRGYYQSLRPTQMGLSLNIDISATAFYKAVPVIDFVAEYLNIRDVSRPLSDTDRVKIKKALKGVRVESTHRTDSRRSYKITGISPRPLNELRFSDQDGKELSVVQYFRERYNYALHYGFWPCLQAGSDSRPAYLPMEVCKIVEGQRYSKKLNERQVTAILRSTCQRPSDRERLILEIVNHNNYHKDCYANEFEIKVMNQLVSIDARVLPAPRLKYHDSGRERMVSPEVGQWNMINKKMVNGGAVERWTCVNFSGLGQDAVHRFCSDLVQMCNNIGMVFNKNPLIAPRTARPERIEATLKEIYGQTSGKENYLQLLVVVLPDFSRSYGKIKRICETEIGIISQCCLPKNVFKCNKQYLENLALKINVKVGGRNTQLEEEISKNIPPFNGLPTIIFGADVTHPPPGEDSSPSIAAVVASMDWPEATKYKGLVSAQARREEIIRDLFNVSHDPGKGTFFGGMIRELLIAFRRSTNMKPQRIIFYRDGVSEGQFSQVLLHEMDAIRRACASLEDGYLPPVTFVVVQKRHHTRLFPEMHGRRDLTDRSGNILPGTVVDTRICHPREFDFYLCSHAGIQGTSRPTHYHVLFDENNFSADALQTLTNKLCYTYARCTRSVSIVPPAYYAHLAAFRARYYTEDEPSDGMSSSPAPGAGGEVRPLPKIKDNVKEVMFYC